MVSAIAVAKTTSAPSNVRVGRTGAVYPARSLAVFRYHFGRQAALATDLL